MAIPKVFISYSHDSLEHKKWVLDLAIRLRNNGIDSIIDQWELKPGDDLPHFMETNLANSDFVLMICTDLYVEKANLGKGGVGYEKMIITSNLLTGIDENKIIPIIKQTGEHKTPTFLKTKIYIDLSNTSNFEFEMDDLLRTIHKSPLFKKPPVGNNPFKKQDDSEELKSKSGIYELMTIIVDYFESSNDHYIRYNDIRADMEISRIYLDILINEAVELGYIRRDAEGDIVLLNKGKLYAINNEIIK